MRSVLADVELMECVFHWTQALWRKVITSYRICNIYMYMYMTSINCVVHYRFQKSALQLTSSNISMSF